MSAIRILMNNHFVVASHILAGLSLLDDRPITSEVLAESLNTNATFVRRILGELRDAGLVTSQRGPRGGFSLAREPEQISLFEVYLALEGDPLLDLPDHDPDPLCPIGNNVLPAMKEAFAPVEKALQEALAEISVKQIAIEIQNRTTDRALQQVIVSTHSDE